MTTQPLRDWEVRTNDGKIFFVRKTNVEVTNEGTLVFRNGEGEMVEAYGPAGWTRMSRR